MPTIGPYTPDSQLQDAGNGGTRDWNFGGSITLNDDLPVDCTFTPNDASLTKSLVALDFDIPADDLPNGAVVSQLNFSIKHKADYFDTGGPSTYIGQARVKLVVGGAVVGNYVGLSDSPQTTYGIATANLINGGVVPSAAQMRAINFGIVIEYENNDDAGNTNKVYIDYVELTSVVFTVPTSGHANRLLMGVG